MDIAPRIRVRAGRVFGRSVFSILLASAFALHCSDGAPEVDEPGGVKDPCTSIYEGQCGVPCDDTNVCAAGLHCSDSICTAQCGPGASLCDEGQGCSADGHCTVGGGGSSGNTGGTGATGGTGIQVDASVGGAGNETGEGGSENCAAIELELADVTPSVVLLIDQSGSMSSDELEPDLTRWDALKAALTSETGPIATLESKVRFGFAFYSNPAGLDEPPEEGVCPILDKGGMDETLMPPALDRFAAFSEYFLPLDTRPNTPTAESFELAAADLAAFDEPGPKFVVLATDGNPDRCEVNNENAAGATGGALSKQMVVDNVQAAFEDEDITTFVISVGDDVAEDHLRMVANVGQGFPADDTEDRFYQVTTQDALISAFEEIIDGVRSCTLTLNGEIDPDQADKGEVLLDGEPIDMDENDGWVVVDSSTIELKGEACEAIKSGDHTLSARFPCEVVVVPPVPK